MLICEDLLLLLTDDATGKVVTDGTATPLVLAGGVLVELAMSGRVRVAGPGEAVRQGRVVVVDASPTGDDVLDEALRRIAGSAPAKAHTVLDRLGKRLRHALLDRLVQRGVLRAEEGRVLGIFPADRWPTVDGRREADVRRGLGDVLVRGRTPTEREVALVSLLLAVDKVHLVSESMPRREAKARAKQVADGEPAGAAVKKAIEAVQAATIAAITAATVVVTTS